MKNFYEKLGNDHVLLFPYQSRIKNHKHNLRTQLSYIIRSFSHWVSAVKQEQFRTPAVH